MTEEHLSALIQAAEAKKDADGWWSFDEGRHLTLHVVAEGALLSVSRIVALKDAGTLLHARTERGEIFIVERAHAFAGSVDAPSRGGRKAGFR